MSRKENALSMGTAMVIASLIEAILLKTIGSTRATQVDVARIIATMAKKGAEEEGGRASARRRR